MHGPLGPEGVYRIASGGSSVQTLLVVPDAGNDLHERGDNYQPDDRGRKYPGKTSLGDI